MPRVWSGYCGGIVTDALSDPECRGLGGGLVREPPSQPREAQTYRVSLTKHMQMIQFPVEGCLGGASNQANLRVNFLHRHTRDTIVIMEEWNQPYPRCPQCDMFVSHKALNGRHMNKAFCQHVA